MEFLVDASYSFLMILMLSFGYNGGYFAISWANAGVLALTGADATTRTPD